MTEEESEFMAELYDELADELAENEKQQELNYWEYAEHVALMQK